MTAKRLHFIIITLLCLVLLRGLIYGLIIPFDRSPDEYHHFKLIKAKQLQFNGSSETERRAVAARIGVVRYYLLHSQAKSGKTSVKDFADKHLPSPPSSLQVYYWFSAQILKLLALEQISLEIYVMRGVSMLCGVLIVFLAFLTAREIFPENVFMVVGAPALIAFIPQFSAMNGVISDDKFAEVFLALLFWLIVRIFSRGIKWRYVPVFILTLGLALLSKRTAVFFLPFCPLALLVYYWKSALGIRMHLLLLLLVVGMCIGGYHLLEYADEMGGFISTYVIWAWPEKIKQFLAQAYSRAALKYYAKFFTVLYWSFWGVFGYMTIHLHHFWYMLTASVQLLSICGLGRFVFRVKMKKIAIEQRQLKILHSFAMSIVCLLIIVILRSIVFRFGDPFLAQGRRFFAVILPISVLTMLGIEQFIPPRYHRITGITGIIGLIILDVVCLSNYILLNFHNITLF